MFGMDEILGAVIAGSIINTDEYKELERTHRKETDDFIQRNKEKNMIAFTIAREMLQDPMAQVMAARTYITNKFGEAGEEAADMAIRHYAELAMLQHRMVVEE